LTAVLKLLPCCQSRRCTHRCESLEPHHFEVLCRWRSGESVRRGIPLGALWETRRTTAGISLPSSGYQSKSEVEEW